jgi:hypothetical protein
VDWFLANPGKNVQVASDTTPIPLIAIEYSVWMHSQGIKSIKNL